MGMDTIMYLKDPRDRTKMVNLLMDHTQFTQAYVKTAIEEQQKLYDSYNCSNDHSASYALLDSLDISFKRYVKDHLPDDFCFPLVWMQVIKALQSDSLECFKTIKCELENIKPQQYPGQNVTDMSLDMTYHCQALTTAGVWDHQLCSSILSTFLLTNGDEMYCHSLIAMKASLEDELKKVRFMEHADGTTQIHRNRLTNAGICDLTETWYEEAKGVGKWPPATHAKDSKAPPSSFTQAEVHTLVQCFQKGQSTSKPCDKSNDTCNLCREKGHWANECPNKACFATTPCSDKAKPNRCSSGPSRCPGCRNSHGNHANCQEGQGEQQASKQSWKYIPLTGMESTKLVD